MMMKVLFTLFVMAVLAFSAAARSLLPTMECDYSLVASGDICVGESQNPWGYTKILSTKDYASSATSRYNDQPDLLSEEAYCRVYCNSDPACLGFVAVAVDEGEGEHWFQCRVSFEAPTQAYSYSEFSTSTWKCWSKVQESCRVLPTAMPSPSPPTAEPSTLPLPAESHATARPTALALDESCDNCVAAGCTWCEADDFFDDPEDSLCVCEELTDCSDFLFGSDPKEKCGTTLGERLGKVPVFMWGPLVFISFCLWIFCCTMIVKCRGGGLGDDHSDHPHGTNQQGWVFANTGLEQSSSGQQSNPTHSDQPSFFAQMFGVLNENVTLQTNSGGDSVAVGGGTTYSSSNNNDDYGGSSFGCSNAFGSSGGGGCGGGGGSSFGCSNDFGSSGGGGFSCDND